MIRPPALRAHQLRSVGPGQRWLVELELTPDGRIQQRINEGTPEPQGSWQTIGSWTDAEAERKRLAAAGWDIDS